MNESEIRRRVYADPERREAFRQYIAGLLSLETYQRIRDDRIAAITAEPRGVARHRLIKCAMSSLKGGRDQEEVMQHLLSDDSAARLEPDLDDRYYWARGILNFCEHCLHMHAWQG